MPVTVRLSADISAQDGRGVSVVGCRPLSCLCVAPLLRVAVVPVLGAAWYSGSSCQSSAHTAAGNTRATTKNAHHKVLGAVCAAFCLLSVSGRRPGGCFCIGFLVVSLLWVSRNLWPLWQRPQRPGLRCNTGKNKGAHTKPTCNVPEGALCSPTKAYPRLSPLIDRANPCQPLGAASLEVGGVFSPWTVLAVPDAVPDWTARVDSWVRRNRDRSQRCGIGWHQV